jgi:hypothetical protein
MKQSQVVVSVGPTINWRWLLRMELVYENLSRYEVAFKHSCKMETKGNETLLAILVGRRVATRSASCKTANRWTERLE